MSEVPGPERWVELGQKMIAERRKRGWSQRELAVRAQLSRSAVQAVERGYRHGTPYRRLSLPHFTIGQLFGWTPEMMDRMLAGPAVVAEPKPLYAVMLPTGDAGGLWYQAMDITTDRELAESWALKRRGRVAVIGQLLPQAETGASGESALHG